jgi:hypothetical protein
MNTITEHKGDIPARNVARAARVDKLRKAYEAILGEVPDARTDYTHLASIVADMRHWCDVNGIDFGAVTHLSVEHYKAEQGEGESE